MYVIFSLFIFLAIGAVPTALTGYMPLNWQWWAACAPLWLGVFLRDYAMQHM